MDEAAFNPFLVSTLQKSFSKWEASEDKHDARLIGQMNEPELSRRLWQQSSQPEWDVTKSVEAIFHPGLVRQKERHYLKSSADACLVCDSDTDDGAEAVHFMPVELKTLVDTTNADRFKEMPMSNVGCNTHRENELHFRTIDEEEAKMWAPNSNWLFQMLHQAATFKTNQSLLVVGTERRLLLGLVIAHPPSLIDALLSIVDWVHNEQGLKDLCRTDGLSEETKTAINDCLKSDKLKRACVDCDAFETNCDIWSRLNVDTQADIHFPLPRTSRIIPHNNAHWNSTKSPSDTATKNIDSCNEKLGVRTPQTLTVARMLQLNVRVRCFQQKMTLMHGTTPFGIFATPPPIA